MNNKIIVFSLLFFFSITSNLLVAQSYLSFGSDGVQHEDTLYVGDSIHFSFWIVNEGNVSVNDTVQVLCETFDFFGASISSMTIGDAYNVSGTLDVGDSIFITITEVVNLSSYVLGDNIIVIWPASILPGNSDTSSTPIHILNSVPASIELSLFSRELRIFPNPANDYLMAFNELGFPMEGLAILDNQGNLLYVEKGIVLSPFYFDLSVFHSGVYYMITSINGQQIAKKVILAE